ncbi:excalibur calcium-binding domain-containing protein [Kitasatospora sp. NBC_00374]|uniref:excalibur calcium-binding domain-containing protein n=1 Tax=Kitasatospora sp. NBC_00374 TaxID=2975964 RepID=UPI003252336E
MCRCRWPPPSPKPSDPSSRAWPPPPQNRPPHHRACTTAGAPTLAQPASHRCTAEPGCRPELDQDGDGVACEPPP